MVDLAGLRSGGKLVIAALLLQLGGIAWAQSTPARTAVVYSCTDAEGRTISSDRPIAACSDRPLRELNKDGSLRRVIPPPLTKEQERLQAEAESRRRMEERDRRARSARDRNLLLTFEDENALEAMRRRTLAEIDNEIVQATQRILAAEKELKAAQQAVEAFKAEKPGRAVPFPLQQRVSEVANRILAEDALISDRTSERARLDEKFDADAKRLRELLGQPADNRIAAREPDSRSR